MMERTRRSPSPHRRSRRAERREGAAMLVVMMILLMSTATALFAVHSTTFEIRAAGHTRLAMQAQYVGESALMAARHKVEQVGGDGLARLLVRTSAAQAGTSLPMTGMNEPDVMVGKEAYRFYRPDLIFGATTPAAADRAAIGANRSAAPGAGFDTEYVVDVYDFVVWTAVVAGESAHMPDPRPRYRATLTSRGRIRYAGDTTVTGDDRPFHESASDARAHVLIRSQ